MKHHRLLFLYVFMAYFNEEKLSFYDILAEGVRSASWKWGRGAIRLLEMCVWGVQSAPGNVWGGAVRLLEMGGYNPPWGPIK